MKKKRFRKNQTAQLSLFRAKLPRVFGGALLKGHAKMARPLSTKEPVHLVLKSERALGTRSLLQKSNAQRVDQIIRQHAKRCRIRIYHLVNVGNHLHLVLKLDDRKLYAQFIRAVTGLIARHVLKSERGPSKENDDAKCKKKTSFWVARPFTRLVTWGKDYTFLNRYMKKNRSQAKRFFVPWGFDVTDASLIQNLSTA